MAAQLLVLKGKADGYLDFTSLVSSMGSDMVYDSQFVPSKKMPNYIVG
jgi:hypothetical protein